MTKFIDSKNTKSIELLKNGISFEADFFEVGGLKYDEEKEAYVVKDIDYLVDYAKDMINGVGDFLGYPNNDVILNVC